MEEELKNILTACIIESLPRIAAAIATEINAQPKRVETMCRREAANSLGVSLPTVDALIANGTIRVKRIGRRVVIPQTEITNLLEEGEYKYQRRAKV